MIFFSLRSNDIFSSDFGATGESKKLKNTVEPQWSLISKSRIDALKVHNLLIKIWDYQQYIYMIFFV